MAFDEVNADAQVILSAIKRARAGFKDAVAVWEELRSGIAAIGSARKQAVRQYLAAGGGDVDAVLAKAVALDDVSAYCKTKLA